MKLLELCVGKEVNNYMGVLKDTKWNSVYISDIIIKVFGEQWHYWEIPYLMNGIELNRDSGMFDSGWDEDEEI